MSTTRPKRSTLQMAEEARQQAQKQTPAQRAASIERGMAIINAGAPPAAKQPIPFAPGWDEQRWHQLFDLRTLLNELTTINHGSGAIERLQRCIVLAEQLRHDDLSGRTVSFTQFLMRQAVVEEKP